MLSANVPDGYLITLLGLFGTLTLGFAGWIAREMYRTSSLLARMQEKQDDTDRRLDALEARPLAQEAK